MSCCLSGLIATFFYCTDIFTETGRQCLKEHGNEADFLGFLQKSVPHESRSTQNFEQFRFSLRIRGDIRNRKTTRRVGESTILLIDTIFFKPLNKSMVIVNNILVLRNYPRPETDYSS
jgi:hypothetical protein